MRVACVIIILLTKYAGMYKTSDVHQEIQDGKMPSWAHVVLDEAFGCSEQELVSWASGKKKISQEKDAFNYYLSAQRQSVERVFGVMYQRWGILWRQMHFSFDRYKLILVALSRLHNFIRLDRELAKLSTRVQLCHEDDTMWRRGLEPDGQMPLETEMVLVANTADRNRAAGSGQGHRADRVSDKRRLITLAMKYHNVRRPAGSKAAQAVRALNREVGPFSCA